MPQKTVPRHSIGARRNPASAEAILAAAETILSERGPSGFSIEAVARLARAGKPTIYRWWPSKAALLLDVYHRQKHDTAGPICDSGDLERDVATFLRRLLRHWRETPAGTVFRSIIAQAQSDDAAAAALNSYHAERLEDVATIVERARTRGQTRPDIDPLTAADLITGYAWARLLSGRLEDDESLERAAAHLVGGWRVEETPA